MVTSSDGLLKRPRRCTVRTTSLMGMARMLQQELQLTSSMVQGHGAISISYDDQWVTQIGNLPREATIVISRQTEQERRWLEEEYGWEQGNPLHGQGALEK